MLSSLSHLLPLTVDIEVKHKNPFGLAPNTRPCVGSTMPRTALEWSKQSTGKASTDQKKNVVGNDSVMACISSFLTSFAQVVELQLLTTVLFILSHTYSE